METCSKRQVMRHTQLELRLRSPYDEWIYTRNPLLYTVYSFQACCSMVYTIEILHSWGKQMIGMALHIRAPASGNGNVVEVTSVCGPHDTTGTLACDLRQGWHIGTESRSQIDRKTQITLISMVFCFGAIQIQLFYQCPFLDFDF